MIDGTGRRPVPGKAGDMTSRNRFIMADLDTPKLRPGLRVTTGPEPNSVVIEDQFRLGGPLLLSRAAFDLIRLFDGEKTLASIQVESAILFGGEMVPLDTIANLIAGLDQ